MVCPRCHEEKGRLAAIGALALLTMIHKDVGDVLNEAVLQLRVDPDNWYVHTLITRLFGTTPRQLEAVSAGSLLYAAPAVRRRARLVMASTLGCLRHGDSNSGLHSP
jgi:Predicted membrane protein (DUF2127)